jgi:hypothetical protein
MGHRPYEDQGVDVGKSEEDRVSAGAAVYEDAV